MCFSAEASFTAAALLIPLGGLAVVRAAKVAPKYTPLCALPLLFGLQQAMEGMVWVAGGGPDAAWVERFSLAYMFFSWIAWPVWVPVSVYFLEPPRRRPLYIAFAVGGAMLGGVQYIPYFTHEGWLTTTFLANAISYGDTQLLDALMTREATYLLYLVFIIMPLIVSSDRAARVFGQQCGGKKGLRCRRFVSERRGADRSSQLCEGCPGGHLITASAWSLGAATA